MLCFFLVFPALRYKYLPIFLPFSQYQKDQVNLPDGLVAVLRITIMNLDDRNIFLASIIDRFLYFSIYERAEKQYPDLYARPKGQWKICQYSQCWFCVPGCGS